MLVILFSQNCIPALCSNCMLCSSKQICIFQCRDKSSTSSLLGTLTESGTHWNTNISSANFLLFAFSIPFFFLFKPFLCLFFLFNDYSFNENLSLYNCKVLKHDEAICTWGFALTKANLVKVTFIKRQIKAFAQFTFISGQVFM